MTTPAKLHPNLKVWYTKNQLEAGIDEAGRGSFIGDLYVAAVIWSHDPQDFDAESPLFEQIKDSKKLTPEKRTLLAEYIKDNALSYAVASVTPEDIQKLNVLHATYKGMHKAVRALDVIPEFLLVDGDRFKPFIHGKYGHIPHTTIPQGDNTYLSIAAASILAKTEHDKHIKSLLAENPELAVYHLETNMGYGTKAHREAIQTHGITKYHRKKFCEKYIHTKEPEPEVLSQPEPESYH